MGFKFIYLYIITTFFLSLSFSDTTNILPELGEKLNGVDLFWWEILIIPLIVEFFKLIKNLVAGFLNMPDLRKKPKSPKKKISIIQYLIEDIRKISCFDSCFIFERHNGGYLYSGNSLEKTSVTYETRKDKNILSLISQYQNLPISAFGSFFFEFDLEKRMVSIPDVDDYCLPKKYEIYRGGKDEVVYDNDKTFQNLLNSLDIKSFYGFGIYKKRLSSHTKFKFLPSIKRELIAVVAIANFNKEKELSQDIITHIQSKVSSINDFIKS